MNCCKYSRITIIVDFFFVPECARAAPEFLHPMEGKRKSGFEDVERDFKEDRVAAAIDNSRLYADKRAAMARCAR